MASESSLAAPADPGALGELRERLRRFLSVHLNTKILDSAPGTLKMMVLLAKNQNTKIKDKLINYKLGETAKRLADDGAAPTRRDLVICEFLIEEMEKYVASKLK